MANEIKCYRKTILEVFAARYRVPDYQRPYVWENEQVEALLNDTLEACQGKPDAQFFLGSAVLKTISEREFEILDGQQRLTSLFLIFAVIRDIADNNKLIEKCRRAVFQEKDDFDKKPESLRIIFDIRDDVKNFVEKYVKPNGSTKNLKVFEKIVAKKNNDVSVRNMSAAVIVAQKFLSKLSPDELSAYFTFLWNNVVIVCISTEEFEDALQLFTVLNNRGLKLRNSDILKAINLRVVKNPEEKDRHSRNWQEMENFFGDKIDEFLSCVYTVLAKQKSKGTLLKGFESHIYKNGLLAKGSETFNYVYALFENYVDMFAPEDKDYVVLNYMNLMKNGLQADYWITAALSFYKKFGSEEFGKFVKLLDKKVSADWICSVSPTKRVENIHSIIRKISQVQSTDDIFSSTVFDICLDELKRTLNLSVYGKRYDKYLMLKLELLYHGNGAPFPFGQRISIEHILPQNPAQDSQWLKDFSNDEREEWTDKLGNLVMVTRRKNILLGNPDYAEKRKRYFKKDAEHFAHLYHVYKTYDKWTPAELKQNHEEVVHKLIEAYE